MGPLSEAEIGRFVRDGFVRLDGAFSPAQAQAATARLLAAAAIDPADPSMWPGPVTRIAGSTDPVVVATINTPRLVAAIDQLVGVGEWQPRTHGFGTFPVRFPSQTDPGDTGWHVDGSFGEPPNYKVNLVSRGRALLLLMLFTDTGLDDAPTRIRVGSHHLVARALAALDGDVVFVPQQHAPNTLELPVELATGAAGAIYLCHPFLVHAASWPHTGSSPRVLAQPAIHHHEGEWLGGFDYDARSTAPVARAVQEALDNL